MNRKSVNVAFLSIGIDYFQVLAMFSRSNVKWPERTCVGDVFLSSQLVLAVSSCSVTFIVDLWCSVFPAAELNQFFLMLSAFNFNIDITAPEVCVFGCLLLLCCVTCVSKCVFCVCVCLKVGLESLDLVVAVVSRLVPVPCFLCCVGPRSFSVRHAQCWVQEQVVLYGGSPIGCHGPLLDLPLHPSVQEALHLRTEAKAQLARGVTCRHYFGDDVRQ